LVFSLSCNGSIAPAMSFLSISQHRAHNMRLLAKDLAATGRLRSALSESKAADIIWSMNSPEGAAERRKVPIRKGGALTA
jgi:hypothetical protein